MKPKLNEAIEWIALNDEPGLTDIRTIMNQLTVLLTADLFRVSSLEVTMMILNFRSHNGGTHEA